MMKFDVLAYDRKEDCYLLNVPDLNEIEQDRR